MPIFERISSFFSRPFTSTKRNTSPPINADQRGLSGGKILSVGEFDDHYARTTKTPKFYVEQPCPEATSNNSSVRLPQNAELHSLRSMRSVDSCLWSTNSPENSSALNTLSAPPLHHHIRTSNIYNIGKAGLATHRPSSITSVDEIVKPHEIASLARQARIILGLPTGEASGSSPNHTKSRFSIDSNTWTSMHSRTSSTNL